MGMPGGFGGYGSLPPSFAQQAAAMNAQRDSGLDALFGLGQQAANNSPPAPAAPPKAITRVRAGTIIDMQQRPGDDDWSPVVDA